MWVVIEVKNTKIKSQNTLFFLFFPCGKCNEKHKQKCIDRGEKSETITLIVKAKKPAKRQSVFFFAREIQDSTVLHGIFNYGLEQIIVRFSRVCLLVVLPFFSFFHQLLKLDTTTCTYYILHTTKQRLFFIFFIFFWYQNKQICVLSLLRY
jgi:hypothetical protein